MKPLLDALNQRPHPFDPAQWPRSVAAVLGILCLLWVGVGVSWIWTPPIVQTPPVWIIEVATKGSERFAPSEANAQMHQSPELNLAMTPRAKRPEQPTRTQSAPQS